VTSTTTDPALLVGLDAPDDASVYQLTDELAMVQTVDFFTPVVDDPFDWGRVAAANALSDVYAMGGRPLTALNLVGWPRDLDFELLGRVLEGGSAICDEAGVNIVGGHSIDDPEPKYGLAVTGLIHPDHVVATLGGGPGCDLVLTKPLGMGIISSGIKEGKTSAATAREAIEIMTTLNRAASEAMVTVGVAAATDVTGFGLMGHLLEMLGPTVSARLIADRIPVLDEALQLAASGVLPAGSKRNYEADRQRVDAAELDASLRAVLFDAQTSGGLLIAVVADRTAALMEALEAGGVTGAAVIGSLIEGTGRVEVVAGEDEAASFD
jgi:selenide, water dikinase